MRCHRCASCARVSAVQVTYRDLLVQAVFQSLKPEFMTTDQWTELNADAFANNNPRLKKDSRKRLAKLGPWNWLCVLASRAVCRLMTCTECEMRGAQNPWMVMVSRRMSMLLGGI